MFLQYSVTHYWKWSKRFHHSDRLSPVSGSVSYLARNCYRMLLRIGAENCWLYLLYGDVCVSVCLSVCFSGDISLCFVVKLPCSSTVSCIVPVVLKYVDNFVYSGSINFHCIYYAQLAVSSTCRLMLYMHLHRSLVVGMQLSRTGFNQLCIFLFHLPVTNICINVLMTNSNNIGVSVFFPFFFLPVFLIIPL